MRFYIIKSGLRIQNNRQISIVVSI